MKILYFDCLMGAAGDMLMSSMAEALDVGEELAKRLNDLKIPGVEVTYEKVNSYGVGGGHFKVLIDKKEEDEVLSVESTHPDIIISKSLDKKDKMVVGVSHKNPLKSEHAHGETHDHHHHHHGDSLVNIKKFIESLSLSKKVKEDAINIYNIIGKAESTVHNTNMEQVHFHEVGTKDAIVDIIGCAMLMEMIKPDLVISSPINVGFGTVKCAHGVLPVPAPATALILKDINIFAGDIEGELCTPTGASILKYYVNEIASLPKMSIENVGYGIGTRDFGCFNGLRAVIGFDKGTTGLEKILKLETNVDDMTGEEIAYACQKLRDGGAFDVYTIATSTKKSRQGVLITAFCHLGDEKEIVKLMFKHTSTLGIRREVIERYTLNRHIEKVAIDGAGIVRKKISEDYGCKKFKYEFDDLVAIAEENNLSLGEVKKLIQEEK